MPHDFIVTPGAALKGGVLRVPGDKSVSHRAAILGALNEGTVEVHGFLDGEDCLNTLRAIESLGIEVEREANVIRIHGRGLCGLRAPSGPIDCGNSGTGMRLLAGVLAAQPFASELVGDASLMQRPMRRIADPLNAIGAVVATSEDGKPPVRLAPPEKLQPIHHELPVASAQVKSALLLAGLCAGVPVEITEPDTSRDHTERMLSAGGVPVERDGRQLRMQPVPAFRLGRLDIPGDLSSAAFWLVLAAVQPGLELQLGNVGVNPTRDGVLRLLERMGARIRRENRREQGGEPVADIHCSASTLVAIDIDAADVALAIDEIPVILIAAACADGTTRLRGAAELRVKESDRLAAMAQGLRSLGIEVEEYDDGLDVTGGELQGGEVDSQGDHRIAMAFAIAATRARGPVRIRNIDNVATSYPAFREDLARLGADIQEVTE
ncbi:MAG: 3-phosphoshikimate 1-carboxyvinyltransferase [Gammaproteobacteria bacterium]|nr:3-phosphoshikimate 1-carboxyvinyltransferase [Gammaproteobacteria bacterium]